MTKKLTAEQLKERETSRGKPKQQAPGIDAAMDQAPVAKKATGRKGAWGAALQQKKKKSKGTPRAKREEWKLPYEWLHLVRDEPAIGKVLTRFLTVMHDVSEARELDGFESGQVILRRVQEGLSELYRLQGALVELIRVRSTVELESAPAPTPLVDVKARREGLARLLKVAAGCEEYLKTKLGS